MSAFKSFQDKIPGAVWSERTNTAVSPDDLTEYTFVYFKKIVQQILALLPDDQTAAWDVDEIAFGFADFNLYWLVLYRNWFLTSVAFDDAPTAKVQFSVLSESPSQNCQ